MSGQTEMLAIVSPEPVFQCASCRQIDGSITLEVARRKQEYDNGVIELCLTLILPIMIKVPNTSVDIEEMPSASQPDPSWLTLELIFTNVERL